MSEKKVSGNSEAIEKLNRTPVKAKSKTPVEKQLTANSETKKAGSKPPQDLSRSNKAQIYLAWESGETDTQKLFDKVGGRVKLTTVRGWLQLWKRGLGLPAIAKIKK
jgi:hypothetical protein